LPAVLSADKIDSFSLPRREPRLGPRALPVALEETVDCDRDEDAVVLQFSDQIILWFQYQLEGFQWKKMPAESMLIDVKVHEWSIGFLIGSPIQLQNSAKTLRNHGHLGRSRPRPLDAGSPPPCHRRSGQGRLNPFQ